MAAEVSYATECLPPPISGLPPIQGVTKVELRAPATAKVGDEIEVVWRTVQAASNNPDILDLEQDTIKPSGKVAVAGAQQGELAVEGPRENPPVPRNGPMRLSEMRGTLKLTAVGEVTLAPGFYNINVNKPISTDTACSPKAAVPPAATVTVTDGSGTTSGGTTSGGTTTGPSGGTTTTGGTTTSGGTTSTAGGSSSTAGGTTSTAGGASSTAGGTTSTAGGTSAGGTTGGGGDPDGTAYPGKEVLVPYACKTPIGDKKATSPVRIDARKKGGAFDLTVRFAKSVMDSPVDIPAGAVKPSMAVVVGGADKGTVAVAGPANKDPIKGGQPIVIPDLTGVYTPGASGRATLTPGVLTVSALGTTTVCTPEKDPGASLELTTTAQDGGVTGATTSGGATTTGTATGGGTAGGTAGGPGSGGTSGSGSAAGGPGGGSSGGLAETGAADHGGLKALGLLAGTAVLLGAAVLTLTPWRRLRGTR
ncbi:hypothetical protein [Streptomyces sp. URMC 123]|uniref:hypothetical protein n=1 Tax=Streptomyces sp. URMC 123 TaxID=3423403 RepID=UPI003F1C4076